MSGLDPLNSLSDSDLFLRLSSEQLRVASWASTLSLAHPKLTVLLDDFDERLRRYVRYYHLDDAEYTRKEDIELQELEEGQATKQSAQAQIWSINVS